MKKAIYLLMVAILFFACQPKTEVKPVDFNAAKDEIAKLLSNLDIALSDRDYQTQSIIFTNNALIIGSDPTEFWTKQDFLKLTSEVPHDSTSKPASNITLREIRISADGNSAMAVEQIQAPSFSKKMEIRAIYHLVKTNDIWQIDFFSTDLIPTNEVLTQINKLLEKGF